MVQEEEEKHHINKKRKYYNVQSLRVCGRVHV